MSSFNQATDVDLKTLTETKVLTCVGQEASCDFKVRVKLVKDGLGLHVDVSISPKRETLLDLTAARMSIAEI